MLQNLLKELAGTILRTVRESQHRCGEPWCYDWEAGGHRAEHIMWCVGGSGASESSVSWTDVLCAGSGTEYNQ